MTWSWAFADAASPIKQVQMRIVRIKSNFVAHMTASCPHCAA
jgi:hypothetical protein